jgi:hypothetical protein
MEKEILYEINRFREILGLPLLKESVGGGVIDEFLTLFGKSVDDFEDLVKDGVDDVAESLRNSFDEIAQSGGKTFDDIITDIRAGKLSDDLVNDIAEKLVKSSNREISQKMAEAVVNTNPSLKQMADGLSSDDLFKASKKSNDLQSARKTYEDSLEAIGKRGESNEIKNELDRRLFNNYYSAKSEIEANIKNLTNALKGMLDETGDLTEGIKKEIETISKTIKVKPDVLELRAKQFISGNPNITFEQLQKKLAESQTAVIEAASKLKGVKRAEFKAQYDSFKEYLPKMPPLTKPVKIVLTIASLGVIAGSYVAFEYYQVDEEEAQDILKRLINFCDKKITADHVKALGSDENIDKFYPSVVYDGQLEAVEEKEGQFYLSKKDNVGIPIKLTCGDPKLADKTVEEIQGTIPSGEAKTEYNQTLDDFKKFLATNSLGTDDATNDTGGPSGFWKANGKDYSYDATTKTFKEE